MVKNVRSMLKILYAGCPALSSATLAQFTFEMCDAADNCKKPLKHSILGFKVIDVDTIKKLVTNVCYDKLYAYLCLSPTVLR